MMGVSDREVVRIKPEPSFGIVATTGNFYNCRITSEDLEYALVTAESQELTGDRQTSDLIPVGAGVQGGLSYEPSYAEHDWLMAAALATQVSNVLGTNGEGTGTATFTATGVTVSAGTPFAALEAGQWVRVPNAAQTGNRKLAQVLTVVGAGTGYTVASGTYVPRNRHHRRAVPTAWISGANFSNLLINGVPLSGHHRAQAAAHREEQPAAARRPRRARAVRYGARRLRLRARIRDLHERCHAVQLLRTEHAGSGELRAHGCARQRLS
jgi:hypothetical protein